MHFCKNQSFFVFLASDSISQSHGEGDFAIHYTIDTQVLGSLASLFLFVYKCGYLRALTVYVWSEHPCGISLCLQLLFLLFLLLLFFFFFTGCWLESSVRGFSFFREVFVLFSLKLRSSFAPPEGSILYTLMSHIFLKNAHTHTHSNPKNELIKCDNIYIHIVTNKLWGGPT
jgi:hypothetical protein